MRTGLLAKAVAFVFEQLSSARHFNAGRAVSAVRSSEAAASVASDNGDMPDAITRDVKVMHGTPVFRGTRVPVKVLFDYLEGGETLDDFLEGFPTVSRELALQVLNEAKELRLAHLPCVS